MNKSNNSYNKNIKGKFSKPVGATKPTGKGRFTETKPGEKPVGKGKPDAKPATREPGTLKQYGKPNTYKKPVITSNGPTNADLGLTRLAKRMSELGHCSRREAEDYIERGWVKVNGKIVTEKGYKVQEFDDIVLLSDGSEAQANRVTIIMNKPVGYVSGQPEDGYKAAVELFRPENQWEGDTSGIKYQHSHQRGMAPAGRLDIDSQGLLVITQNGSIAKQLIGENTEKEKEYLVRVTGNIKENGLALLNHGLKLDGKPLKPAIVDWQNEDQLNFKLKEGKKRQIRRMCEMVGLTVVGLKRIRMGKVKLGSLPPGKWRYLAPNEQF